jgi:hypothetical protein
MRRKMGALSGGPIPPCLDPEASLLPLVNEEICSAFSPMLSRTMSGSYMIGATDDVSLGISACPARATHELPGERTMVCEFYEAFVVHALV